MGVYVGQISDEKCEGFEVCMAKTLHFVFEFPQQVII